MKERENLQLKANCMISNGNNRWIMHLSVAIPGGWPRGNPRAFAPRHLQIPPTQDLQARPWPKKSPTAQNLTPKKPN